MLEKLTSEQEKLMIEVRDFWIANSLGGEVDKVRIKEGVKWIYEESKLKEPKVLIFDSYYQLRNIKIKTKASVRASVRASVGASVWASVRASVWASVGASVRDSVGASLSHSEWKAFYDYFEKIGVLNDERFRRYRDIMLAGIWEIYYFENICIVLTKPKCVRKDENGRLHSIEDGAIEWRDGYKDYFIHGVKFEFELWNKIVKGKITAKEILNIENVEQRYVALSVFGAEKLMEEINSKLINTGKNGIELHEIDSLIPNRILKLLKYSCPSTNRVYVSFVPDTIQNANEGMAWKFKISKEEYEILEVES